MKNQSLSFSRITILLSILFFSTTAIAQPGNTGMRFSEYGGSMSTYENPAFGASGKTKWDVHLFNVNNIFENDAIKLKWNSLVTEGSIDFGSNLPQQQQLSSTPSNKVSFRNVLEIHGPAVFYNYKQKYAFGINTRSRFFFQMRGVNRELADAVLNDDDFNLNNYGPIVEDFTNLNLQVLTDIGLTGSAEVLKTKKHSLTAGASLRFYKGIAALDFTAQNINIDPNNIVSGDTVVRFSTDLQLNAASPDELDFLGGNSNGNVTLGNMFGKAAGSGVGGDIGAVYKGELLGHNIRGSVSITDIGKINYNKGKLTSAKFIANNVSIPIDSFASLPSGYDSIKQWAANYGVTIDSGAESFSQALPTRLNLYAEMQMIKGFYVGVSSSANLNSANSKSSNYSSYTAIIPRWQSRMIDVWMPISYNYFSNNLRAGLGARLAYVYFGTDDVASLLTGSGKSFNVYFGLRVAGSYKNRKVEK